MINDLRVTKGVPAGGQFAAGTHTDPNVALAPSGPRIIARVQLQVWSKGYAIDAQDALEIDVTDIVNALPSKERAAISDRSAESDEVFLTAVRLGIIPNWDGPFDVEVTDSLNDYDTRIEGAAAIDEFLTGNIDDLTTDTLRSVPLLNHSFTVKPNVAVHDRDTVDFIYNEDDGHGDVETTRVTLNADGHIIGYGDGQHWEDQNWFAARLAALGVGKFGIPNAAGRTHRLQLPAPHTITAANYGDTKKTYIAELSTVPGAVFVDENGAKRVDFSKLTEQQAYSTKKLLSFGAEQGLL